MKPAKYQCNDCNLFFDINGWLEKPYIPVGLKDGQFYQIDPNVRVKIPICPRCFSQDIQRT